MQLTIGSRAMNLTPERRLAIAQYIRWLRRDAKPWCDPAELRRWHREELSRCIMATEQASQRVCNDRIERTERERYEDRMIERECHTRNALQQMASYRHGGL